MSAVKNLSKSFKKTALYSVNLQFQISITQR